MVVSWRNPGTSRDFPGGRNFEVQVWVWSTSKSSCHRWRSLSVKLIQVFHEEVGVRNTSKFSWGSWGKKHIWVFMRKFGCATHLSFHVVGEEVGARSTSKFSWGSLTLRKWTTRWILESEHEQPHEKLPLTPGSFHFKSATTSQQRWVANPNFLMKTQMCFLPQLPHRPHENLDELQAQTSSWKLRCASDPNFLTDDMKT
jgi:hypothetical protein